MSVNAASAGYFPNPLQARCPKTLPPIIERAAQSQCMTASEYMGVCASGGFKRESIRSARFET
jgi:hypothetical protein